MHGCAQAAPAHSTIAAGKSDTACHKQAVLPIIMERQGACRLVILLQWRLPPYTTSPAQPRTPCLLTLQALLARAAGLPHLLALHVRLARAL